MARALKVYRTPIGFHDAYVAAASKAAALRAWGTDRDLFARGAAELVTDPALTTAPLAHPGEIITRLRGSVDEQMAAAGKAVSIRQRRAPVVPPKTKPPPRPSRAALDKAEHALERVAEARRAALQPIAEQIERLERERRAIEKTHDAKRIRLEDARDTAEEAYHAAVEKWRRATV